MSEYPRLGVEVSFYAVVKRKEKSLVVAIPKEVRNRYDIREGDVVKVTVVRVVRSER